MVEKNSKPRISYKSSSLKFIICYRCDQVSISSTSGGTNDTYFTRWLWRLGNIMRIKVFGMCENAVKIVRWHVLVTSPSNTPTWGPCNLSITRTLNGVAWKEQSLGSDCVSSSAESTIWMSLNKLIILTHSYFFTYKVKLAILFSLSSEEY